MPKTDRLKQTSLWLNADLHAKIKEKGFKMAYLIGLGFDAATNKESATEKLQFLLNENARLVEKVQRLAKMNWELTQVKK